MKTSILCAVDVVTAERLYATLGDDEKVVDYLYSNICGPVPLRKEERYIARNNVLSETDIEYIGKATKYLLLNIYKKFGLNVTDNYLTNVLMDERENELLSCFIPDNLTEVRFLKNIYHGEKSIILLIVDSNLTRKYPRQLSDQHKEMDESRLRDLADLLFTKYKNGVLFHGVILSDLTKK